VILGVVPPAARSDPDPPLPDASDAELIVLRELWSGGAAGPGVLRERLERAGVTWAYTTVQTLLHRLLEKGFVARRREGAVQIYEVVVTQDDLVVRQVQDLARRVAEGSASSLIHCFVRGKGLSKREISRLRALLDEAEKEGPAPRTRPGR